MRSLLLILLAVSLLNAHASYTAYSGASGSKGTCASSCHGSGTGTISMTGIPETYTPGAVYTITVKNSSGSSISNYNCSTRKGSTAVVAGTFTAGTNSAVYTVTGYESGVRASANNVTSSVFQWTAPAKGTGSVTFYLAGLQGSKSGASTKLTVTSSELATGVQENIAAPSVFQLEQNFPNPFNPSTLIRYSIPVSGNVELKVTDIIGNEIAVLVNEYQEQGTHTAVMDLSTTRSLSSGIYFYSLRMNDRVQTKRMVILK
ncbi:MAG: choice-of-anchor V domain-containing protein [Bacteroidota bacterium]